MLFHLTHGAQTVAAVAVKKLHNPSVFRKLDPDRISNGVAAGGKRLVPQLRPPAVQRHPKLPPPVPLHVIRRPYQLGKQLRRRQTAAAAETELVQPPSAAFRHYEERPVPAKGDPVGESQSPVQNPHALVPRVVRQHPPGSLSSVERHEIFSALENRAAVGEVHDSGSLVDVQTVREPERDSLHRVGEMLGEPASGPHPEEAEVGVGDVEIAGGAVELEAQRPAADRFGVRVGGSVAESSVPVRERDGELGPAAGPAVPLEDPAVGDADVGPGTVAVECYALRAEAAGEGDLAVSPTRIIGTVAGGATVEEQQEGKEKERAEHEQPTVFISVL
ncbi:unnamed protein product [Cuscuta campestris]|uniref:Uncharacterized protein n=1 Tax=Cuscuta campestris TaxID=132261 RepID=A0A484L3A8_9ASTE|nr:unnamed protein product [Cuscuta campestris]